MFGKYSVCIAAILILLSGCGSKEERLAEHLAKGRAFYAESNFDKARLELKNVLKIDPKNADAYYTIGLIEERERNWPKAFANYSQAVEVMPTHAAAKAKVGKFYLLSGEIGKAEKIASELLAANPNDIAGRTLRAAITARKGDRAKAIAEVEAVVASAPADSDAAAFLATLYLGNKQPERAETVIRNSLKTGNKDIGLRFELIRILLARNDLKGAEEQYKAIIAAEPKTFSHRQALALFYNRSNRVKEAENVLREAIKADPKDEQRYLVLAQFFAAQNRFDQADKELSAGIKELSKAYQLRFAQVELSQRTKQLDKARAQLDEIIEMDKTGQHGLRARNQLARMDLAKGDKAAATKRVGEVLKESPRDNDALLLRARMALADKQYTNAIADLRSVLKDQPESVEVIGLLTAAHMANREPQLAKETFSNAVNRAAQNVNLRLAYAQFLARIGDLDGSLKQLDEALQRAPKDARVILTKAEVEAAKKDWSAAEATTAKLKEIQPDHPFSSYRMGLVYLAQGKNEQAAIELEKALAKAPAAIEPLTALVNVRTREGKFDDALARIDAGLKAQPNSFAIMQLKGEVYAAQGKLAEAETTLRQAIAANPKAVGPYAALARVALRQGNANAAVQILQQGLAALPANPQLSVDLAQVYQLAGKPDQAIAQYEAMLKRDPKNNLVANNLASLLSDSRTDTASLERALQVAKPLEASGNPTYIDTVGWIYFKLGRTDDAVRLLNQVVAKAPQIPIFQYHLGMALYKKGDVTAAKQHLQLAVNTKDNYPGLEEAKATLAKIAG